MLIPNEPALPAVTQFTIALCDWYICELQNQQVHKALADLERKLFNHEPDPDLHKHLPAKELNNFFEYVRAYASRHTYQILPHVATLITKTLPEIQQLLYMQLRLAKLQNDQKYTPDADFNLNLEISKFIKTHGQYKQALQKSVTEIYTSQHLQNLLNHGFTNDYSSNFTNLVNSLKELKAQTFTAEFKEYFTVHLESKCDLILTIPHKIITNLQIMQDSALQIMGDNPTDLQQVIKILPAAKSTFNLSVATSSKPQHYHAPNLIVTVTKFTTNIASDTWLNYLDVSKFEELCADYEIITLVDKYMVSAVQLLSSYGVPLVKVQAISANTQLIHLQIKVMLENLAFADDFTIAKELLKTFLACFGRSAYQEIVVDHSEISNLQEISEYILRENLATVVFSDAALAAVANQVTNDASLAILNITPEIKDLQQQTQNVLALGFIPALESEALASLKIQTLAQALVLNDSLPYTSILAQLRFCTENGVCVKLLPTIIGIIAEKLTQGSQTELLKISIFTPADLQFKIQLSLDLGMIPQLELDKPHNFAIWQQVSSNAIFTLNHHNPELAYQQFSQCFKQGIFIKFANDTNGHKIIENLNQRQLNHPFIVNFNDVHSCINAAQYLSETGLRFHYTMESWLKVITYANSKDLTLSLTFKHPNFYDLKRLIENGFIIQLDQEDKQHLLNEIAQLGKNDLSNLIIVFAKYPINSAKALFYKTEYLEELNQLSQYPISYFNDPITESNNLLELAGYLNSILDHTLTSLNLESQISDGDNPIKKLASLEVALKNSSTSMAADFKLSLPKIERMVLGLCVNSIKQETAVMEQRFDRSNKYINLAEKLAQTTSNQVNTKLGNLANLIKKLKQKPTKAPVEMREYFENLSKQEIKIIENLQVLDLEDIEYLSMQAIVQRIRLIDQRLRHDHSYLNAQLLAELKILALKLSKLGFENEL